MATKNPMTELPFCRRPVGPAGTAALMTKGGSLLENDA